MKQLLILLCSAGLMLACYKSDKAVLPGDALYQRWRLKGTDDRFITFLPEGIILYGADGRDNSCCSLHFFVRQDSLLTFKNAVAKPLPVKLKQVDCSAVSCLSASSTEPWRIVSLTTDQLVLTWYNSVQTYEAD